MGFGAINLQYSIGCAQRNGNTQVFGMELGSSSYGDYLLAADITSEDLSLLELRRWSPLEESRRRQDQFAFPIQWPAQGPISTRFDTLDPSLGCRADPVLRMLDGVKSLQS